jgi:uncharacterized protein YprB with RNaseH-like and TPR domain
VLYESLLEVLPNHAHLLMERGQALEPPERWRWLASRFPPREHWRSLHAGGTWPATRWLALDIETTGLAPPHCHVTVVGLCGHATGFEPVALVADAPGWEAQLERYLADSDVLISFNGRQFDVPFLCQSLEWTQDRFPPFHLDLRFAYKRLGLKGGLKKVQVQLGFIREQGVAEVNGYTAVLLWRAHRRGHPAALLTLVRYCLEDVVVLLPMARHAYELLAREEGRNWCPPQVPDVSIAHMPYDEELVRRLGTATAVPRHGGGPSPRRGRGSG